jgi:hypothetical protein
MKTTLIFFSFLILLSSCGSPKKKSETGNSDLIEDTASSKPVTNTPVFNKKVNYKRFSFSISAAGDSANRNFILTPSGYSITNDPITEKINGIVYDLIVSDIDGDDNPEVAVVIASGEKQEGEAFVYSSNKDRSISRVSFPASIADSVFTGYNGHDEFIFVGKNFVRRFPVENKPGSTKLRHMQYRLVKGEAGKHLVLRNVIDL